MVSSESFMTYHTLNDLQEFFDHHSNSLVTQQASHTGKMNVTDKVTVQWRDGVKHGVLKLKQEKKNINSHSSSAYYDLPVHTIADNTSCLPKQTGVSLLAAFSNQEKRKMPTLRYCAVLKFTAQVKPIRYHYGAE